MANPKHLEILQQGVEEWNQWRKGNKDVVPDLYGVQLSEANLMGYDFSEANLTLANLSKANLEKANFSQSILVGANLSESNLKNANLSISTLIGASFHRAKLLHTILNYVNTNQTYILRDEENFSAFKGVDMTEAFMVDVQFSNCDLNGVNMRGAHLMMSNFFRANLTDLNLTDAKLEEVELTEATLIKANLENTTIEGANIYGISAWDLQGTPKEQKDLVITPEDQPRITVDNIEVAQFVYLLLNNQKIRNVIDTITSKAVLILGRFCNERKEILDAIKEELRERDYLPILFDFEKPNNKDLTETIMTLAQMSRFIIADITDAKSIPQELMAIVPHNPSIPVVSIISKEFREYTMYEHFENYPWVLPLYKYGSKEELLKNIKEKVIDPAEQKANVLKPKQKNSVKGAF